MQGLKKNLNRILIYKSGIYFQIFLHIIYICSVYILTLRGRERESARERERMEEEEIEKAVIAYLKKKGFKQTELALQEEQIKNPSASQTDPDVAKRILSFAQYSLYLSLYILLLFLRLI